jgi:hypothetical protein
MADLSRRGLLRALPVAFALSPQPVEVRLSRFMMKGDFPRLEAIAPAYRFVWHGRFFSMRLTSTARLPYDNRISYAAFGSWECGGVDLIGSHYFMPSFEWPDGRPARVGGGTLFRSAQGFRVDHALEGKGTLRAHLQFAAEPPYIRMTVEPSGIEGAGPLLLRLPANFVYDRTRREDRHAAYYSSSLETGLRVAGEHPESASIAATPAGTSIVCRIPTDRKSSWSLCVLDAKEWSNATVPAVTDLTAADYKRVPLQELDQWEPDALFRRGWVPERGRVRERVAGIFICAEGWNYPTGPLQEARMDYVSKSFLPRLSETRKFQSVGLSRDGVTERGRNEDWLRLVEQAHRSGFKVYMKPGDGELGRVLEAGGIASWAKALFDVPEERRCDVVRLPAETIVAPWMTANLCLHSRYHTTAMRKLAGLPWERVRSRIVASVADRFSQVIEAIRRHAPRMVIDLESCDTPVLEELMARHENLGVMYMMYGQYPRVAPYIDLYYSAARKQARAKRVVLETDCYYTGTITGLGQLQGNPAQMYSPNDIELMAAKHRHMNWLPADASWAWGLNITFTPGKLAAIASAV